MIKKPNLNLAYALRTVQDNRNLYAAWAKDYETEFAHHMDYVLPQRVAEIFVEIGGVGPVLDVGAGTGLAGEALLKLGIEPIDALDLSGAPCWKKHPTKKYIKTFSQKTLLNQ